MWVQWGTSDTAGVCAGYKDVCISDASCGCAGVQKQTVLATQVIYILMRKCVVHIDCSVWCIRHRGCFILELSLHSYSSMNWVSGLRFSIPYLAGQLPCCSPLLPLLFQVRLATRSDYIGLVLWVLLGFWAFGPLGFRRFRLFIYFRLSALCCYLYFRRLFYLLDFQRRSWLSNIYKWRFQIFLFIVLFLLLCKSGCHKYTNFQKHINQCYT